LQFIKKIKGTFVWFPSASRHFFSFLFFRFGSFYLFRLKWIVGMIGTRQVQANRWAKNIQWNSCVFTSLHIFTNHQMFCPPVWLQGILAINWKWPWLTDSFPTTSVQTANTLRELGYSSERSACNFFSCLWTNTMSAYKQASTEHKKNL
jgi:hypothetical protein